MTKEQKRHIIATFGTLLFMLLVFLLLWLLQLTAMKPEQEEGIEVAFGEVEEAGGYMAEQSEALPLPAPEATAPEQPSAPSDNDLMTQEDEEALALRKAQEEKEKARKQAEAQERQRHAKSRHGLKPNAKPAKRPKQNAKPKRLRQSPKPTRWVRSSAMPATHPARATAKETDRKVTPSDTAPVEDITGRSPDVTSKVRCLHPPTSSIRMVK